MVPTAVILCCGLYSWLHQVMLTMLFLCCWRQLITQRPSHMLAYLRDGSAQTSIRTEIEAANQTFNLAKSQNTDTGPTSPSAEPITLGTWQGSHWSTNFEVTGVTQPGKKNPWRKRETNPGSAALEADALTIRPARRFHLCDETVIR